METYAGTEVEMKRHEGLLKEALLRFVPGPTSSSWQHRTIDLSSFAITNSDQLLQKLWPHARRWRNISGIVLPKAGSLHTGKLCADCEMQEDLDFFF